MLAMDSFKKLRDSFIKTLSWALVGRCLAWMSLVLGLLVAAAYLGLRWYVWPQLNELGPRVMALMSEQLPRPIELRQMRGDMVAGRPVLRIEGLSMRDDQGQSLLEIGVVEAELSITPLFWGEIDLNRLRLQDVSMAAKRINPHSLQIAAWDIALDKPHDDRWLHWLLSQSRLEVNNMALRWRDDVLASEVLVEGIQLEAVNQLREHRWRIDAKRVGGASRCELGGALSSWLAQKSTTLASLAGEFVFRCSKTRSGRAQPMDRSALAPKLIALGWQSSSGYLDRFFIGPSSQAASAYHRAGFSAQNTDRYLAACALANGVHGNATLPARRPSA